MVPLHDFYMFTVRYESRFEFPQLLSGSVRVIVCLDFVSPPHFSENYKSVVSAKGLVHSNVSAFIDV